MTPRELVKVKELTWSEQYPGGWRAIGITGIEYWASNNGAVMYLPGMDDYDKPHPVPNDAWNIDGYKAACQAHYENSIYEQLIPISFINRGDAVSPTP